jgi:uncharacterized protein (TIGR04222 family)
VTNSPIRSGLIRVVAAALALLLDPAPAVPAVATPPQGWEITSFDDTIALARDGAIEVTETITARFDEPKHGLIREIPVRYVVAGHLYDIRLHLRSVTDGQGAGLKWQRRNEENKLVIKIGDPAATLTGTHTYVIRYKVDRATLWEGETAVLRWNVTGNSWRVPIGKASAAVTVAPDVPPDRVDSTAYTGAYRTSGKDAALSTTGRTLRYDTTRPLGPGEGLTIEVFTPAEFMTRPSWRANLLWWLADNFTYGLFPLGLAACFGAWYLRGRDEPGRGTVVVSYEPPDALGPAEVGTLADERVDLRDISSTIVDLAVRHHVRIHEQKTAGMFGIGSSTDYVFTKNQPPKNLKPYERLLYDRIFGEESSTKLSDLQNQFYDALPLIKKELYGGLTRAGYFAGNPESVRTKYTLLGLLAIILAALAAAAVQYLWIGRVFLVPLIVASLALVPVVIVTGRVMPRRTRKGRIAWETIRGLEEYISRAEVDDLKEQERRHVFERLLPYAVAFGLTKRWSKAFEGLYTQPPDWYRTAGDGPFSMVYLGSSLDNSVRAMNATLPSQPRSEGGIGGDSGWSSGGFGGGGSVGGGFGGGGGDAW